MIISDKSISSSWFAQGTHRETKKNTLTDFLNGNHESLLDYELEMGTSQSCKVLCIAHLSLDDLKRFELLIKRGYRVELTLDNLPLLMAMESGDDRRSLQGYPVGEIIGADLNIFETQNSLSGS